MKKLINGIIEFHLKRRDLVKNTFAQLALGQKPDVFFIACSDSRVAVNVFASTEPGDLFVIRNAGNFVTPYSSSNLVPEDESEVAALEFALEYLKCTAHYCLWPFGLRCGEGPLPRTRKSCIASFAFLASAR